VNNKNYHTVGTVPNRRYRRKIETITHIYVLVSVHALPKVVLWVHTSHLSLKYVSSIAVTFFRQVYQRIYSLWHMNRKQLPSWSLSHNSWIYNYPCNPADG
jgi:hypothetical protein